MADSKEMKNQKQAGGIFKHDVHLWEKVNLIWM